MGILTYKHRAISTGLPVMSQKYQLCQRFLISSKIAVLCSSVLLVLTTSSVISLSQSQLLAENMVPSQNLEAASFFQQGVMRYYRNDFQAAEYAFRQALLRDPSLAAAHNYLGSIMLQQNRLDIAVQEYSEAIKINPNLGEAYYNIGLALHKQGQKEPAITAYRQALVINPTMAKAHYNLGLVLYEIGRLDEAMTAYEQAINLDKSNADAYSNLAIALQDKGQTQQAIAAYRKSVEINPDNALAYNNLAGLLAVQGQTAEAIAVYQEAIRRIPNNVTAYYNLGVAWYQKGDYKKANVALKRARDTYRQQGNIEEADKVEQLMQQITLFAAQKKTQVGQNPASPSPETANSNVVVPASETSAQTQNQPDSPVTGEQTPALFPETPIQPADSTNTQN